MNSMAEDPLTRHLKALFAKLFQSVNESEPDNIGRKPQTFKIEMTRYTPKKTYSFEVEAYMGSKLRRLFEPATRKGASARGKYPSLLKPDLS